MSGLRRGIGLLVLFAGAFAVTFFDPQSFVPRVALASGATVLLLLDRLLAGRHREAESGRGAPAGTKGLGLRSGILDRWPRIVGWLPGFRLARPDRLPERLSTFRGRSAELDELTEALAGKRLVILHGMPGIGKSALSQELAHRVKADYPDGQLYENLGLSEKPKHPSAVLKDFLKELGWPEREIPVDPAKRVNLFRTLTSNRRVLVVLDAARDPSQLRDLLPGGPGCAVIVTSRRNLSTEVDGFSFLVQPPSVPDATQILRAHAGPNPSEAPAHAAAIVWSCGRLPRALAAAGALVHRSAASSPYADVAGQLKPADGRLDLLTFEGTDLSTDFASEYRQLSQREQRALHLFTLIESPTFVSWTLRPMMGISLDEAEKIIARLRSVHMLETANPSGPSRSRFHPLVREFVCGRRDDAETGGLPEAEQLRARAALSRAYLVVIRAVLAGAGEAVAEPAGTDAALLPPAYVLEHILGHRERWVRDEYTNLLRSVRVAPPALAWRIARWLGDHVPRGLSRDEVREVLEPVAEAPGTSAQGRLWVRLALAGHATAIGDYAYARSRLTAVLERSQRLPLVAAVAHRRLAQLELTVGDRPAAAEAAAQADQRLRVAGQVADKSAFQPSGEEGLLRLIMYRGRSWGEPASWIAPVPGDSVQSYHDIAQFIMSLTNAERARRQHRWEVARELLDKAYHYQRDDAFRLASIEYERARVALSQAMRAAEPERTNGIESAIAFAARSMLINKQMGSELAELRARCHLSRALTTGGYFAEASRQAERAESDLRKIVPEAIGDAYDLLLARVRRARGEALLGGVEAPGGRVPRPRSGGEQDHGEGPRDVIALLEDAQKLFARHGEWWSAAELDLGLSRAYRLAGEHGQAMKRAAGAYVAFEAADDPDSCAQAMAEVTAAREALT